jgi:hypothetical protein
VDRTSKVVDRASRPIVPLTLRQQVEQYAPTPHVTVVTDTTMSTDGQCSCGWSTHDYGTNRVVSGRVVGWRVDTHRNAQVVR